MLKLVVLLLLLQGSRLGETDYTHILAERRGFDEEVVMPDGTRCDLVSADYAIEVEWAYKWKEAPAQAVLYSIWTTKKPGIILLVRDSNKEKPSILRCKLVCERLNIQMEVIHVKNLVEQERPL